MDTTSSFERVLSAIGTRAEMMAFFGVSDAALSQWKKDGFPPARALEIERRLKGKIRAADLITTDKKAKAA